MSWRVKYLENLEAANAVSAPFRDYFDAFALAAERAVANVSDTIDPVYVGSLESRVKQLEGSLRTTIEQLNRAQQRNRDMNEEQYMKTHAVQELNDEIIALNLQLNMTIDTQQRLEQENRELVARWVAKVDADASAQGAQ